MAITTNLLETDYTQYACNISIAGQPLNGGLEIISVQVKKAYQYITSTQIIFKTNTGLNSNSALSMPGADMQLIGKALVVKAKREFDEIELFDGIVVRQKYKNSSGGTRLQVTAKTKAINMLLNRSSEVFGLQTDKDVVESLISKCGCTMATSNVTTQFTVKHTQLVKNELNDWDFINVRAEANGCFIYTEKDTVTLDRPTAEVNPLNIITARYGNNVFDLELEQDDRKSQVSRELISFNLTSFENEVTKEETPPATGQPSPVKGLNAAINYRTFNDSETTDLVNSGTQVKQLSRLNGLVHMKANLGVKPGNTLEIAGFNVLVDGRFIVTSVMHDYSTGGFSSYVQFGLNHQSYVSKYKLQSEEKMPVIITAIVTQLQDDPDNLSRIKVRIAAWQNAPESLWARLSTVYAGKEYGLVVLPEIGDEVIVAFMGHDFDTPVVLGSIFSPKFPPHTAFKDDNYDKVLITKKGMKWSWNDEKAIHEISTPKGNKILISEEDAGITIQDQNSNSIVMNDSELNIMGSKNINIKANSNIKIEGVNIDISASGGQTLKGSPIKIN